MFLAKLFFTVLLADFVSGLVHWLEDAYARPGMPFLDKIAADNLLHHAKPRAFLAKSWWESSADLVIAGVITLLVAAALGHLNGWLITFVVLVVNANQIHKWTHQNRQENPWFVRKLQRASILQTPRHHALHHRGERNSHYCVITNVLNPVLEKIRFWSSLEAVIEWLTGVARRRDADYLGGVKG